MLLTGTSRKQVEDILKLCWHKYNMLNVAIFYNFDSKNESILLERRDKSFLLAFYDPFAIIEGKRGYVYTYKMIDNDNFTASIVEKMLNRLNDVKQYPLKICIFDINGTATPVFNPNGTITRFKNRDGNLMHTLATTMNFKPIYHKPRDLEPGTFHANGSMKGCLRDVESGETDIFANMRPVLDVGQVNSEFIVPIDEYKFAFITPYSDPRFVVTFLNVFSKNFYLLWILAFMIIVFMLKGSNNIIEIILILFGITVRVSQPKLNAKLLIITWSLFSLLNGLIYEATMVEYLTKGKVSTNIKRMRDLKDNTMTIFIFPSFKNIFKDMADPKSGIDYYQNFYERQKLITNFDEPIQRIARQKNAVLMTSLLLANIMKEQSEFKEDLHIVDSGPPSRLCSNLIPITSPYKSKFDEIYMKVLEFGFMPKWSDDVLEYLMQKNVEIVDDDDEVYTMRELIFIFWYFLVCCSFCCLIFCLELFVYYFWRRKKLC